MAGVVFAVIFCVISVLVRAVFESFFRLMIEMAFSRSSNKLLDELSQVVFCSYARLNVRIPHAKAQSSGF